ncbi:MAG: protein TonB, partial [Gammaproteobacteria bacterium]|nr:protein TonB [Gammaproteobacteria bacterium]
MIARYGVAIGIGAAVTFGLLFVMQLLIASGRGELADDKNARIVDFVRVERENVVETKKEKPEKPPEPEKQPETPQNNNMDNFSNSLAVSMSSPTLSGGLDIGGVGFGVSDGEYLPIVKVAPVY